MNISTINIINNPLTFYKLDPGEPGIAPPTPASQSAFTVFNQEARNRQRLKAEALLEGKEVIFLNTEYKVRKNGSFLTMVGGTTTIVTREKEKNENSLDNTVDNKNIKENEKSQNNNELEIKENILKAEQKRLKIELRTATEEERKIIEERLKEIEMELKEIKKLKQDKSRGEENNPLNNSLQSFLNALENPAGLILDLIA